MAAGTVSVFDEALIYITDNQWASADVMKVQLCTGTLLVPSTATPVLADCTEATTAELATTLDTWTNMTSEVGGTFTFDDTGTYVEWALDTDGSTAITYAVIYNDTQTSPAVDPLLCTIDMGTARNIQNGSLRITWDTANGIFTIA